MKTTINQRFKIIMDKFDLKQTSFARRIEISQPTMKSIIDGNTKPSFDTLHRVLIEFTINAEWLMMGTGEMLKQENTTTPKDDISTTLDKFNKRLESIENMLSHPYAAEKTPDYKRVEKKI